MHGRLVVGSVLYKDIIPSVEVVGSFFLCRVSIRYAACAQCKSRVRCLSQGAARYNRCLGTPESWCMWCVCML